MAIAVAWWRLVRVCFCETQRKSAPSQPPVNSSTAQKQGLINGTVTKARMTVGGATGGSGVELELIEKDILKTLSTRGFSKELNLKLGKLPDGNRKNRLLGLLEEAKGNFDHGFYGASNSSILAASTPNSSILAASTPVTTSTPGESNPSILATSTPAASLVDSTMTPELHKQKVMNHYGRGEMNEAILLLLDYLSVWMGDHEAWFRLSHFYTCLAMYHQSIYALQQVLLICPDHHLYLISMANLLSLFSSREKAHESLLYYCASLERVETLQAWIGVYEICKRIVEFDGAAAKTEKEGVDYKAEKEVVDYKAAKTEKEGVDYKKALVKDVDYKALVQLAQKRYTSSQLGVMHLHPFVGLRISTRNLLFLMSTLVYLNRDLLGTREEG